MKKFVLILALAIVVCAAIARAEDSDQKALQLKVDSLQQDVRQLQEQARQKRTGLQNPDISAAIDLIGSYSEAANNINFTPRDVELMIQANADPFAKAYMVLNAESELEPTEKSDPFSEVSVGMEEAAIQTTDLPYGLAVKAGAFFADFTRLGKVHSHDLPFVDRPPSLEQIIGGEDKARGVELSWLPPIDHYIRLTLGVVDDIGADTAVNNTLETADGDDSDAFASDEHRSVDALTYYGRAATLLELGMSAVLHLGVDASHGGNETTRDMASADFKLEWKPDPRANNLLEIAGEWLTSKYDGPLVEDPAAVAETQNATADASGGYVYAQYRLTPIWQPGVRFDYTKPESFEEDADSTISKVDNDLYTYSAYLTAYMSEFNRLRVQVNYVQSDTDIVDGHDTDTQIFLQWSVVLGAHKHDFVP